jgi:ATP phosphoribosyltransferase
LIYSGIKQLNIMQNKIIIAIPRGRIIKECKSFLNKTSFAPDPLLYSDKTRKLSFKSKDPDINYIKVRAFDVCTFVAFGAAQIGIAGDDVIQEYDYSEVYAPLHLNIGHCRLSVAAQKKLIKKEKPSTWSNIRVATKYPNLSKKYFAQRGIQIEAIKLNGSMELAPSLAMCRRIVDLVSTGKTLEENGLTEIDKIIDVQSKLIVNRSAYKTKTKMIEKIINQIANIIK